MLDQRKAEELYFVCACAQNPTSSHAFTHKHPLAFIPCVFLHIPTGNISGVGCYLCSPAASPPASITFFC